MNIRRSTLEDAEAMLTFLASFWEAGCDTVTQMSSLPTVEQELEWIATRDGDARVLFVAEQEDRIVGMIEGTIPQSQEYAHGCEFGMSVLAPFRGQGIGRELILRLLDWAESKQLWRVELSVFSNNAPAIKLYTSMGFQEDGRRENAVRLRDGGLCDLVQMFKYTATAIDHLEVRG